MPVNKKVSVTIVKWVVGIGLVFVLLGRVELREVLQLVSVCDRFLVLLAFTAFGISRFLEAMRLHVLISGYGFRLRDAVKLLCISIFFNNVAATAVGDGYKLYGLRDRTGSWKTSAALILSERVVGFFVVLSLGGIYALLLHSNISWQAMGGVLPVKSEGAAFMGICAIIVFGIGFVAAKRLAALRSGLNDFWIEIKKVLRAVIIPNLIWVVALTVASQVLIGAKIFLLVKGFHGNMFFVDSVFIMLLLFIATYIPISIGSLGVREAVLVLSLVFFGVSEPIGIGVALLARIIMYVYAGLGGIVFALSKEKDMAQNVQSAL
jgi:uncharacterized membrane protein YbhN (UPF0104 family)